MINFNSIFENINFRGGSSDFIKYFGSALIWLAFILFFTYSGLFVIAVQIDANLIQIYYNIQCRLVSVFVNFGLLFMLVIDYLLSDKKKHSRLLVMCLICFFIIVGLYGHAKFHETGKLDRFVSPFCSDEFSFILQTIFITMLLFIRYRTIIPSRRIFTVKKIDK